MACEVDPAFVQALEHRPNLHVVEDGSIPLIDLSPVTCSLENQSLSKLVSSIEYACREWGFFQVINHGVSTEVLRKMKKEAENFFHLPLEEKKKVGRDEVNPLGYYETEHTKNVRDWKEVFDFTVEEPMVIPVSSVHGCMETQLFKNQWPLQSPHFRDVCVEYAKEVEKLAFILLELIALSLGLPEKRLNGFFENQTSFIRLNHYPPCPRPYLALGVGRHKDAGALTVLSQDDVGGLDVKRKIDGEWIGVAYIEDSFIINVGDIIQVWSNDKYESVEHRVRVNPERERFSIPFFFNPAHNTMVKPLEEITKGSNPSKYREYNWGEFFKARKNSNFKKLQNENVQIDHFKITQ